MDGSRRRIELALLLGPVLALMALGVVMAAAVVGRPNAVAHGVVQPLVVRQAIAVAVAVLLATAVWLVTAERLLRIAPLLFGVCLAIGVAVFVPGLGVHAFGASRWLRVGPVSMSVSPWVILGTALLLAAWGRVAPALPHAGLQDTPGRLPQRRRALALVWSLLAVALLVAEPDFSAAAIAALTALAALAGVGFGGRRLALSVLLLALALGWAASQFGYVGGRMSGFLKPEHDKRGRGYEVLALARSRNAAGSTLTGVGLGHGTARRRLSSPESDYVFAVAREELGNLTAAGVVLAWGLLGGGVLIAARRPMDRRRRALLLAGGAALLTPALLHVAVCSGIVPIIGVSMPFVSYDPSATVVGGAEVGIIAAVLVPRRAPDPLSCSNPPSNQS